jgi:DNA-3-methyladenine glycosylase
MLDLSFYQQHSTLSLAQKLLGCTLVHQTEAGTTVGKIVETEAYLYDDAACHAFKGKTQRTLPMFEAAGIAYVYLIYGMYDCFNIVGGKEGQGEAVLIRALEPLEGLDLMKERRKTENHKNLCNGPGKLALAMGISRQNNFQSMVSETLFCKKNKLKKQEIIQTTRIGISQATDFLYRFYLKDNAFISKK